MMETKPKMLDLDAARAKLAGSRGKRYWRSLEELSDTPEFQAWLEDEFPNRRSLMEIDRRSFLKFMGASLALAGLAGCRGVFLDEQKVVPYVKAPEDLIPGKPLYYASTIPFYGYAFGVLVESHEGRPTKIEGNPEHPASLGAARSAIQAEILNLYDPDRSMVVLKGGDVGTWDGFLADLRPHLDKVKAAGGAGLVILSETITSPTLGDQIDELMKAYPKAQWFQYDPLAKDNRAIALRAGFGKPVEPVIDFSKAKVVVSLDDDLLNDLRAGVRYARDLSSGRRPGGAMNRVYSFETTPTITGAFADHRWGVRPSDIPAIANAIAAGVKGGAQPATAVGAKAVGAIVKDLLANKGAAIVVAGDNAAPDVHAVVASINNALNAPVNYIPSPQVRPQPAREALDGFLAAMDARPDTLLILGGNPAFNTPAGKKVADAIGKAAFKVRYGLYEDETSSLCDYHLPATHALEAWSDARAFDGTPSVTQPLTLPLYESWSIHELVSALTGPKVDGHTLVQSYWAKQGVKDNAWREALYSGVIGKASAPIAGLKLADAAPAATPHPGGMELSLVPDPSIGDGRYANNGWLQETPKPISQLVWDNAALLSVSDAEKMGVVFGDIVELKVKGQSVKIPAMPQPGQPDGVVGLYLGGGRKRGGTVLEGAGVDVYPLFDLQGGPQGVEVAKTGEKAEKLVCTQLHHAMEGRDIVRSGTVDELAKNPNLAPAPEEIEGPRDEELHAKVKGEENGPAVNLYPGEVFETNLPQWGMTIDLSLCTGCNACVTACQAENNIPVVGKDQVWRGREMHWLRIDRYYGPGDEEDAIKHPRVEFQPMACHHCEKAPCEPVCPVGATIHSHEGLNQMVYNRCVGTRYCSNNCPYKVRRFNFLNFTDNNPQFVTIDPLMLRARSNGSTPKKSGIQLLKMLSNPDVTVRGRGVMEKCTYCVQRINHARIEAKKQNREIADGEIVTACQQACPTNTIVFGNIADHESKVAKSREDKRAYKVLEELNTRPRTSYLGRVRNPNPEALA